MLRASARATNDTIDFEVIISDKAGDGGIPHGLMLTAFAEAVLGIDDAELIDARQRISNELGDAVILVRVETSQKGTLGRVIYANSITLTPGTVSVRLDEGAILVHALDENFARELEEGEMNRRVAKLETGR